VDATIIIDSLPSLLKATLMTIFLAVISIIIALVIGFFTAIIRILKVKILNGVANIYVSIIRGTPLLVQIFVIYYGLPQIGIALDPISSGIMALSLNAGAYLSESFRASILAVDNGQMEASMSMGMTYSQALRRIILPQSLRIAIPTLSNTFIVLIKDTSLAYLLSVLRDSNARKPLLYLTTILPYRQFRYEKSDDGEYHQ